MESTTLTLSSVGQITIPRKIRKLLNLEKGSKLHLEVNQKTNTITLKKQKTHEEIFAELEEFHKTLPKPDPKLRNMPINEMYDLVEDTGDETWV